MYPEDTPVPLSPHESTQITMAELESKEVKNEHSPHGILKEQRLKLLKKITDNLSAYEQLKVKQSGNIYVGEYKMPDWSGTLPFYAFNCEKHGIVVNYPIGHMKMLLCPYCIEEN